MMDALEGAAQAASDLVQIVQTASVTLNDARNALEREGETARKAAVVPGLAALELGAKGVITEEGAASPHAGESHRSDE